MRLNLNGQALEIGSWRLIVRPSGLYRVQYNYTQTANSWSGQHNSKLRTRYEQIEFEVPSGFVFKYLRNRGVFLKNPD